MGGRLMLYAGEGVFFAMFMILLTQHKWNMPKVEPSTFDGNYDEYYLPQPGDFFKYKVYQSSYFVYLRNSFLLRSEYKDIYSVDDIISGPSMGDDIFDDPDVTFDFNALTDDDLNEALGIKKVRSSIET